MSDETQSLTIAWMRKLDEKMDKMRMTLTDLRSDVAMLRTHVNNIGRDVTQFDDRLIAMDMKLDKRFDHLERRRALRDPT